MKPPKKIQPRDSHEDRLKKKPMRRPFDDDDDDVDADDDPERALGMIRNLFRFVSITVSPCIGELMLLPRWFNVKVTFIGEYKWLGNMHLFRLLS